MFTEIEAITFDDFNTLRYQVKEEEDIIYPIIRFMEAKIEINENEFLTTYFRVDRAYRDTLKETLRESLLDNIILEVLETLELEAGKEIIRKAIDKGLASRKAFWYPDAIETLLTLRNRNYKLGLISNTHWRLLEKVKDELNKYFLVITLSYEYGYAKPHPSIFLEMLKKLGVNANCCLHVGDDPIADVQGAKGVGMKTAFIKRRDKETDADIIIEKLSDLLDFLPAKL